MDMRTRTMLVSALAVTLAVTLAAGGCGDDDDPLGPATSTPPRVGAAFPTTTGDGVVLVNAEGTRFVVHDPSDGSFSSSRPIAEAEADNPFGTVHAGVHDANTNPGQTFFFDETGQQVAHFDRRGAAPTVDVETFGTSIFAAAPLPHVGAAFVLGTQLFVFDRGGLQYAAYNQTNGTWSPAYSFSSDFGGGGAPIAAVGASYVRGAGASEIVLFDLSGDEFTIYSTGGVFSPAFDIGDLGDGSLRF